MRERHGLPVALDNDANAAAIAEWQAGAGARCARRRDADPRDGRRRRPDPRRQAVSRRDRQRRRARSHRARARRAALRSAAASATSSPSPRARRPTASLARSTGRARTRTTSSAARREGEPEAVEALAGVGRYLGAGIASFVNVFEPEVVVVGGGFGAAGELLLAPAREVVAVEGLEPARDNVRIVRGRARRRSRRDRRRDGRVRGARRGELVPLAVCATPIGNLEDVTLRVLRELAEADVVLAEDTRHTRGLLDRHGIRARLALLPRAQRGEADGGAAPAPAGRRARSRWSATPACRGSAIRARGSSRRRWRRACR